MHKSKYFVMLALCAGLVTACSRQASNNNSVQFTAAAEHDPNPNHDPDVQRGYDQQKQEHQQQQQQNGDNYRVIRSGGGHEGVPTSGGYPPEHNNS